MRKIFLIEYIVSVFDLNVVLLGKAIDKKK